MAGAVKCRCDCCGIIFRVEIEEDVHPCPTCKGCRIYIMGKKYVVLDAQDNTVQTTITEDGDIVKEEDSNV